MDRSASCELFGLTAGWQRSNRGVVADGGSVHADDDRILCHCLRVTYGEVSAAIAAHGCRTVRGVMKKTMAGGGCTACHRRIRQLLAEAERRQAAERSVVEPATS
ncbi:MAG: (2Fe-2S)-binding protein [Planctomycetota bacterium]|nr:MAG: (2Fe-2S)-binding protein [Planctomycetota bacterium]